MHADIIIDVTGETCPIPLVEMRKAVMKAEKGNVIEVRGTHGASKQEIPMAVDSLGLALIKTEESDGIWHIYIQKQADLMKMTMELMGISKSQMEDKWIDTYGAVGMYVKETEGAEKTLFI